MAGKEGTWSPVLPAPLAGWEGAWGKAWTSGSWPYPSYEPFKYPDGARIDSNGCLC